MNQNIDMDVVNLARGSQVALNRIYGQHTRINPRQYVPNMYPPQQIQGPMEDYYNQPEVGPQHLQSQPLVNTVVRLPDGRVVDLEERYRQSEGIAPTPGTSLPQYKNFDIPQYEQGRNAPSDRNQGSPRLSFEETVLKELKDIKKVLNKLLRLSTNDIVPSGPAKPRAPRQPKEKVETKNEDNSGFDELPSGLSCPDFKSSDSE